MGLLDKVKDTAKQVSEKAQHGMELGKEKIEDVKLKKRISDAKEEIGDVVYSQRTGSGAADADSQIDALVEQITEAMKQLESSDADD